MNRSRIMIPELRSFELFAAYADAKLGNPESFHAHRMCEIYVNISGDVRFQVEDKLYPVSRGAVIITRPSEYHCVHNDIPEHHYFCILFDPEPNSRELFHLFFQRKKGENNFFLPNRNESEKIFDLCTKLADNTVPIMQKMILFFTLLDLLNGANCHKSAPPPTADIGFALNYINTHISEPLSVETIATSAHVSVNTLERHFQKEIGMSPTEYIKERRLFHAINLLNNGHSVQSASDQSGFCTCSYFISLFKKKYHTTPRQWMQTPK